jgi:ADP-ribose pyrophosphatase YjhB (NUDIX family)
VVVQDDNRVLVIKRADDGRWVPPGGVLELGETPQDGCAREVLEETGYQIEVGPLTGVYKNMTLGVVSLAFRCTVVGGQAHASGESTEVCWRTLDEVRRDVPEARAIRILDALESEGVPVRAHDGAQLIKGEDHVARLESHKQIPWPEAKGTSRESAACRDSEPSPQEVSVTSRKTAT